MLRNSWTLAPAAIAAIAVELAAPLALLGRRIAAIWAGMAIVFHFAILAVMAIVFPYHLLGIALSPLLPIERLGTRVAELLKGRRLKGRRWRQTTEPRT